MYRQKCTSRERVSFPSHDRGGRSYWALPVGAKKMAIPKGTAEFLAFVGTLRNLMVITTLSHVMYTLGGT